VSVRIGVGLASFAFESPKGFWRWVERCEASPVDSIWQTDRLISGEPYLESISAMAALAGGTSRLKFGMNAVVLPLRDPLVLARQCATIDFLSGGRLLPVFGVGSDRAPEWQATGRDPSARGRLANETLLLLRRLWSEAEVSFEGEFYRYAGARIAPRPVQQPLPCWIGGQSPAAVRRTARLGTGWLAGVATAAQVARVISEIRRELERTGRSIDPDHYGASLAFRFGSLHDPEVQALGAARARAAGDVDPADLLAVGDADAVRARFRAYFEAGASKFVAIPLARGEADVMEQTERLIGEVLPVVHALG
jgi:probable F420-dependent oxidoreductase